MLPQSSANHFLALWFIILKLVVFSTNDDEGYWKWIDLGFVLMENESYNQTYAQRC